jgi:hypothetical protein
MKSARGWEKVIMTTYKMTKKTPIRKYTRKTGNKDRTS